MPCIICFPQQEVWSCSTQATTRTGISDSFPLFLGLHHVLPEHGIQHACRTEKKAQLKELCWIRNNGFQNLNSSQQDRISLPPQLHFLIAVMDTTKFFIYRETRYENIQFLIANFSWFCGQSQAFLLFLLGMQYGQCFMGCTFTHRWDLGCTDQGQCPCTFRDTGPVLKKYMYI